jgi:hypothetical protein
MWTDIDIDWLIILLVLSVGGFFLWLTTKKTGRAKVASDRLQRDIRLYEHIQTGMREYDLRDQKERFGEAKNGQLLFETAHMSASHVDHPIQSRVGFYFKDINEFGLYGFFAGEGDEFQESYYRSDRTFQQEELLLYDDE